MGKRKKLTARKDVQELIKNMDPASCGPSCQTAPVPPEVLKLNEEFKDLFPKDLPPGLPPSRPTDHKIEFPEKYRVPAPRLYRLAPKEDAELQVQLKDLLARGHIKEVTSPFGSGILFVPKANGKLRMVVDYRPINKLTLVDKYPLPRIDEMLDQVGDACYFSKLDLHSGFHQIRVAPEHVERTAFRTKYGTFAFQVMPFGLCNAPATFQKTMNYIFQDLRKFAGAYIDDILVFNKNLPEHLSALRQVYEKLRKERFFAGPDKCTWAQPEVEYCGFILGRQGIRPQPQKLLAIRHWPVPKDVSDVRSFLGLCGFYQRFVPDYSTVAAPLTDLMQKGREWAWFPAQQNAFELLKSRLLQAPVLIHPDMTKPFLLHTDASDVGVGATLSQLDTEGIPRLIACRSKKLNKAQLNYPVHEKEMFALIDALDEWRHYLFGSEVHIFTDNSALRYLQDSARPSSR